MSIKPQLACGTRTFRLIPTLAISDRFGLLHRAQVFYPAGVADDPLPSAAGGIDDGVVVGSEAVREQASLQVQPEPLDRIEFR